MEAQEDLRQEIKQNERQFISKIEDLISNNYAPLLNSKYMKSLEKIKFCYENPNLSFLEAENCSKQHFEKYQKFEKLLFRVLRKYENGISICASGCAKEIEPVNKYCFYEIFEK